MRNRCFPIKISKNGPYFEDNMGQPFFWQADTCWKLFWEFTWEEACLYLKDRAEKGFSVIQVHMLPHHVYQRNRYGHAPFIVDGQVDRIGEEYFAHVDQVLRYAEEVGLAVAIAPMWLSSWEQDWNAIYSKDNVLKYATAVARRYASFPNIIAWIHGGDDDAPHLREGVIETAKIFQAISPQILGSYHAGICGGWPMFGEEDWYDFCMAYTYDYSDCICQLKDAKQKYPHKPVVLAETHYEGNQDIAGHVIRAFAYTSAIIGGAGHTYGHKDIWMATMFWQSALYSECSHHMQIMKEFWDEIPWTRLRADLEGEVLETVRSKMPHASANQLPVAISEEQDFLLAYINDHRMFKLRPEGKWQGFWMDPVSGRKHEIEVQPSATMRIPGYNAGGHYDWVLCIHKNS